MLLQNKKDWSHIQKHHCRLEIVRIIANIGGKARTPF
jgi:hypothetical protein